MRKLTDTFIELYGEYEWRKSVSSGKLVIIDGNSEKVHVAKKAKPLKKQVTQTFEIEEPEESVCLSVSDSSESEFTVDPIEEEAMNRKMSALGKMEKMTSIDLDWEEKREEKEFIA